MAVITTLAGALGMSLGWGIVASDDEMGVGGWMGLIFGGLRDLVGEMCIFIVCALLYV